MAKLTKQEQQQYDKCLGQCTQCLVGADCTLRIKVKDIRKVDVRIYNYKWTCPDCGRHNIIYGLGIPLVKCHNYRCKQEFQINPPKHALEK